MWNKLKDIFKQWMDDSKARLKVLLPMWGKALVSNIGAILLCVIIVMCAVKMVPVLDKIRPGLHVLSGFWIFPRIRKLLDKLVRR